MPIAPTLVVDLMESRQCSRGVPLPRALLQKFDGRSQARAANHEAGDNRKN
jgi:hypothetical protein